jgi:hypothetical protein
MVNVHMNKLRMNKTLDVFNNLTVDTPTYTMAYKYAAFDGFKRLAAGGGSLQSFGSEQK